MKTQRINTRTTNKPKKVTFKSNQEETQRSLQNYKNKTITNRI